MTNHPDIRSGWFAAVIPGTAGMPEANVLTKVRLSGIDVFDSAGRAVRDSLVTSGSDTRSDDESLARAVPEPGSLILLGMGGDSSVPGWCGG
jgi:hypothetical protein